MPSLLRSFFRKTRASRIPCEIGVLLFDQGPEPVEATLVNTSDTGVRLSCPHKARLAQATMMLIPELAEAMKLQLVWRAGDNAGYRILASCRVRGFVDPEFDRVKSAWEGLLLSDSALARKRFEGGRSA